MTSLAEHTETQILPNEVLQSIFEKLDISQLLIVGQVNTQWRENSRSSSIWRNMNLSISEKGILCSMSGHYRSTLPNSTQPITLKPTIRFAQLHKGYILESSNIVHMTRSIAVTKHLTTSLKDQLNLVQHLNAPLHDISDHHLIKFLTHMPSLRHISLERCRSLTVNVIPFLPTLVRGLVSIDLSNTYMDDSALRFLVRNSPFLVELTISQCPRVTDEGVIGICEFIADRVKVLKIAACFAVSKEGFRKGLSDLAIRASKLEYLDLSSNSGNIDHEIMLEFAALRNARIRAQKLRRDDNYSVTSVKALVINIKGDGWEFTKDEVDEVQALDPSLQLLHNAKMANHSEDGVKAYLDYLMGAY